MISRGVTRSAAAGVVLLFLQSCASTHHPIAPSPLGKAASSAEMERVISTPGPVDLEVVASADWSVPLSGLLNLDSPKAKEAAVQDRDEPIQIYAYVIHHPTQGNFIVDTGIPERLIQDPAGLGISWIIRKGLHTEKMKLLKSTGAIVTGVQGKVTGVFLTHLHFDHIFGLRDIPDSAPIYMGKAEAAARPWTNAFTQGSTDRLLAGKGPLLEWPFQADPSGQFESVVDIFGDGAVFAISSAGHTSGSTAYLVRTKTGPVLLAGDTCHTRWGWEHEVEPGSFTWNQELNLANLKRLHALVARHPEIRVRLGHQP